jgi:hypothetical protein
MIVREANTVGEIYGCGLPLTSTYVGFGAKQPPKGGGYLVLGAGLGLGSLSWSPTFGIVRRVERNHG